MLTRFTFKRLILVGMMIFSAFSLVAAQETEEPAPTDEAVATDEAGDSRCIGGTIPVEHALGEVCIPEGVERVVAIEWTYIEDLLALGVQPVGVADIEGYNTYVQIPITLDESVADVGSRAEPNLEVIASLNPDLILTVDFRAAQNYEALSAIAPTIVFAAFPADVTVSQYDEMINSLTTIARVMGLEVEGEAAVASLNDTYARAQSALDEAGRLGEPFILSQGGRVGDVVGFRLFTDNSVAAQVLEQIGLENAWDDAPQLYGYTEIGIEGFSELQDDVFNFF